MKEDKFYNITKRIIDITASIVGIVVTGPILIIVSILIRIESEGPALFKQRRVGKDGIEFDMYKLRSMRMDAENLKAGLSAKNKMDGPMFKIKDDPRVTTIGKLIRRTSIDELPQLFNVLKGEMSLVGPRPSLPEEVKYFEKWMLKRMEVKPGLTCYWQIQGRNSIDFQSWMKLDLKYIEERSTIGDIKLILKTFILLFGDENAS